MKYLCRLMEIFVLSYFINENRNNFYMKTKLYIYSQSNYLSRTAIEAKILFAVCLSKKRALTRGKSLACEDKCSKKIGAVLVQQADRRSFKANVVPTLVYFYILCNNKNYKKASEFLRTRCLHQPFKQQF